MNAGIQRAGGAYINALKAEFQKLRHSPIWIAVVLIPLVGIFLGAGSFTVNRDAFTTGTDWFNFWTQDTLFFGYFFYPLLVSVFCAYLWRLEHFGHNWNSLMTSSVPPAVVWFSKLTVVFVFAFVFEALNVLYYWIAGKFFLRITGPIPPYFWWWLVGGPICIMAVGAYELFLSMMVKSFAIPPAVCMVGCVIGLGCYNKGWWFFPNTLGIIGINGQHEGTPSLFEVFEVFSGTLFWVLLFSALGIWFLSKRDVRE